MKKSIEVPVCPNCQQVFELCECSLEEQIDAFRRESIKLYKQEDPLKLGGDRCKDTYKLNLNLNYNRFRR